MPPRLHELFLAFFVASLTAFGGALPWVHRMLVDKKRWVTEEEFTNTMALCQFLPGPNIINMSVAVGARFRGIPGAITCVVGLLAFPVACVLVAGVLYTEYANTQAVRGMLAGLGAAAAGLVTALTVKMALPLLRTRPWTAGPMLAAAFIAVGLMRVPLVWALLVLAPISVALVWRPR